MYINVILVKNIRRGIKLDPFAPTAGEWNEIARSITFLTIAPRLFSLMRSIEVIIIEILQLY